VGQGLQKPSLGDRFLAFIYKLLPKIGPLKVLQFKTPTPDTEHMFEAVSTTPVDQYRELLKEERETQKPAVSNDNFDLGGERAREYNLSDTTRARLLDELAQQKFAGTPPEIRTELFGYFAADTPFS